MFPVGWSLLGLISALWYAGAGIWTLLEATPENSLISSSSSDNKVRVSKPHAAGSSSPGAPSEAGISSWGMPESHHHVWMENKVSPWDALVPARLVLALQDNAACRELCPWLLQKHLVLRGYPGKGAGCHLLCGSHMARLAFPNAFCRTVTVSARWEPQSSKKRQQNDPVQ